MKLNRLLFSNPNYVLEGEIDFSSSTFTSNIKKILSTSVKITGSEFEDLLMLKINIKANVVGICSYTLEDVEIPLDINENIEISNEIQDDDTIFYEPNNIFSIDDYILSLILANVPSKIIKKGAKLPSGGEGYRVLTEDQYEEEQKNKKDSRWDVLDSIDL